MPQYQADVWLGSASGRQRVYVNSNTWLGAREQIKTIYHVQETDIWNLCESREVSNTQVDLGTFGGFIAILIVIAFWKYILALAAIGSIIWLIYKFSNKQ